MMRRGGFSLLETIIGIALIMAVFVSVFGVFRLTIQMVGRSKAKVGALALSNEQMEFIRNLSYDDVGTVGGIPSGNIPQTSVVSLNGINYTIRTLVQYVDDPKDGEGTDDENGLTADYKLVKVEASWTAPRSANPVYLISNIVPKGIETTEGGGTLIIKVFDASVLPVASANVHIENSGISPAISIDISTNSDGKVFFPGSPAASRYEITVTKDGYSAAQTYSADANNVNPNPGHLSVIEGETTEASFSIDKVSSKMVYIWEPVAEFNWNDTFDDWSKVADSASTTAINGNAVLEEESPGSYWPNGYLESENIGVIDYIVNWNEFSWTDNRPINTSIKYRIYYYDVTPELVLIPESDLMGNAAGFESSPIDLSGLNVAAYNVLRLKANFSTSDDSITPELFYWQLNWDAGPIPIGNISFQMQGEKTIGKDAGGDSVYKYAKNLSTGAGGSALLENLEWDIYNISIDGAVSGYDISESCPFQPVNIAPNTANSTDLYLVSHTDNTLLVNVEDASGALIEGASARLYKTGYDETQMTSSCGQTFFTPLSGESYTLEISKTGYETDSFPVDVSGQTTLEVIMNEL